MRTIVFDTQALLAFYLGETGSERVETYLEMVSGGEAIGYLNIINLTEFYYILLRVSQETAEEKARNLRSFGVKIVPVTDGSPLWKEAAVIKAANALSLGDAFSAATALTRRGTLLTGSDIEFERVKGLKIERVSA